MFWGIAFLEFILGPVLIWASFVNGSEWASAGIGIGLILMGFLCIGLGLEEAIKSAVDQLQKSSSLVPLSGSAGVQKGVSGAEAKNTPESG